MTPHAGFWVTSRTPKRYQTQALVLLCVQCAFTFFCSDAKDLAGKLTVTVCMVLLIEGECQSRVGKLQLLLLWEKMDAILRVVADTNPQFENWTGRL